VRWDKGANGEHLPETAGIACDDCGSIWTEQERRKALAALATTPGFGWRQTKTFVCCEEEQQPTQWDATGRSLCRHCGQRAPYDGHAGFWASKLYSARHRLSDLVREFLEAKGDPELLKKFQNTALAEVWEPQGGEQLDARLHCAC
jgi:phage terminase large subunit GpA-like protein